MRGYRDFGRDTLFIVFVEIGVIGLMRVIGLIGFIGLIGRISLILCGSGAVRRQPLPGLRDGLFGDSLRLLRSRGGVWRGSLLTAPSLKDAEIDLLLR